MRQKLVITALITALLALIPTPALASSWDVSLRGPHLTQTTETSVSINWQTEEMTLGILQYADEDFYQRSHGRYNHLRLDGFDTQHRINLHNLEPDTRYHYRLWIRLKPTDDFSFTTLGGESFTFIVYGDSQEQLPIFTQMERHQLVAERIAQEENIDFVIHAGDLVAEGEDAEEWGRFFEAAGDMLANTAFYPTHGNHDDGSSIYDEVFGLPNWYSFDCGQAHFIMMNSNMATDFDAETAWLQNDLNNSDAALKFVCYHHPSYSSNINHWGGWTHTRDMWETDFINHGVTAVFSGHVHAYERYRENDITYAVVGTGGGGLYPLDENKYPGYQNSLENTLGYAKITVTGDQAVMQFIEVAEVSPEDGEISLYPPGTVYETVNLTGGAVGSASMPVTANVVMPLLGIALDRSQIDYGDISPGQSSTLEELGIYNIGTLNALVTVEVAGASDIAQGFYGSSLYIDDEIYHPEMVIGEIPVDDSRRVTTQLKTPPDWNQGGVQTAEFIFWAESP